MDTGTRELILDSELPTGEYDHQRARRLPSTKVILEHWTPILHDLDRAITDDDGELLCWFCSHPKALERAHILAVIAGGSDDPANLHLLCNACHRMSEELYGRDYWLWFDRPLTERMADTARWMWDHYPVEATDAARADGFTDEQIAVACAAMFGATEIPPPGTPVPERKPVVRTKEREPRPGLPRLPFRKRLVAAEDEKRFPPALLDDLLDAAGFEHDPTIRAAFHDVIVKDDHRDSVPRLALRALQRQAIPHQWRGPLLSDLGDTPPERNEP